jgi:hypothetical protein
MKLVYVALVFIIASFIKGCSGTKNIYDYNNYQEQGVVENIDNAYYNNTYIAPSFQLGEELSKVKKHLQEVKNYAFSKGLNTDYFFIINMRLPCYKKRFFVYGGKKDSLLNTALVAHGIGSETFKGKLIFSNIPNSKQSSLGKYKIGASYTGIWGFSYKLHGLDSSNNKAFERAIVLHSHKIIQDQEAGESAIGFSHGCPMVSANFLKTLKGYISKSKKPILLSIIY